MKKTAKSLFRMAIITCLGICLNLSAAPMTVKADENQTVENTYTVTYRPGNIARFSDSLYQEYVGQYTSNAVTRSQATGSIRITVPAGAAYPRVPNAGDVEFDAAHEGKYYLDTASWPTQQTVTENGDYVADYIALVDSVEYTIRFVDASSGEDVAPPVISVGNKNTKITYTARNIEGYQYDSYVKEMTLGSAGTENIIQFQYTSTTGPNVIIEEIPGRTVTDYDYVQGPGTDIYENVTVPAANVNPGGGGADNAALEGEDTTTIPEEEVPLDDGTQGGGDEGTAGDETDGNLTEIPEEEVPLGSGEETPGNVSPLVLGGIFAAVIVLGGGVFFIFRRKNHLNHNTSEHE
ncbi:hypothetical protein [Diplocloster modestus]|uniref:MucBP domain-containing protein n=1 Tax=Diplocloster modestus TaxID=2850322 RepID=A0ABS6K7N9_9FIRM|nr:hypothetical protein [Diplocloster modestus]MBU9726518.1 hypothetical protein [Diplocloster modestus]